MSRLRRATVWLGVLGAICAAGIAFGATASVGGAATVSPQTTTHSHWMAVDSSTWSGDAALPAAPERASAPSSDRTDPIRPVLLWWVAAIAALLVAITTPRRAWSSPSIGARTGTWSRRFDRGPPLGLSIP